jgi:hypothetical protein
MFSHEIDSMAIHAGAPDRFTGCRCLPRSRRPQCRLRRLTCPRKTLPREVGNFYLRGSVWRFRVPALVICLRPLLSARSGLFPWQEIDLTAPVVAVLPATAASLQIYAMSPDSDECLALCGKCLFGNVNVTGGFTPSISHALASLVGAESDSAASYGEHL